MVIGIPVAAVMGISSLVFLLVAGKHIIGCHSHFPDTMRRTAYFAPYVRPEGR